MLDAALGVSERVATEVGAGGVTVDREIAKVTVVGVGMKTESGVAARIFRILADNGINIEMISTSPIRISCVVRGNEVVAAVKALHTGLGLDGEEGS
jgi:aspartate kinase